ncbi:MAG: prepilin-type N-terminal cleavage/methylation domain-containing protein [Opitutaceae bacterium]|jgi:prepilin-type N-terminal cleavage/methylation domain-containing protein|nr:prepilin-type N-terminal cleavage/methylation domain-containing protein [Opitutaceae bacterium]
MQHTTHPIYPAQSGHQRAFTLVELLTVIAIISILAAIIIPAVGTVRVKARQTVNASNLRQLGVAMQAYFSENNRFPIPDGATLNPNVDGILNESYDSILKPWIDGNRGILHSPFDNGIDTRSYAINNRGTTRDGKNYRGAIGLDPYTIESPGHKIVLHEWYTADNLPFEARFSASGNFENLARNEPTAALMVDGHVALIPVAHQNHADAGSYYFVIAWPNDDKKPMP